MALIVKLDPSIKFSRRESDVTSYVASDPRTGKYFRFGAQEFHVTMLLDGARTIAQVSEILTGQGVNWTEIETLAFARQLIDQRLASLVAPAASGTPSGSQHVEQSSEAPQDAPPPQESKPQSTSPRPFAAVVRIASGMLSQRFPIANGNAISEVLLPWTGFLFKKPAMFVWSLLVISGIGVAYSSANELGSELQRVFDQQLWLYIAIIWCILKVVHECGHAVCAKLHDVRVGKMGIMFFLFAPLAYVDVTDAWKIVNRRKRVQIALAGVYLELAIGALAAWSWWMLPVGFLKHLAAQVFFIAGPATLLVNANPLLRLDGYYVMSDLLEIPNLRGAGRKRLVDWIERLLLGKPLPPPMMHGWRSDVAILHAMCSVVFQVVWMSGLIFAVSHFAEDFGMRFLGIGLAVVAAMLWGVFPLVRWMVKTWTLEQPKSWGLGVYQHRLIGLILLLALPVQWATSSTSPFARRIPVVARYEGEQIARASSDAFVVAVHVRCGDRVSPGTLLAELHHPELSLKHDQLSDQRDVAASRVLQYRRRGEIALADAEQENAESLERRIAEVAEQIQALNIVAERNGKVTTPNLNRMVGRFLKQGEEVLRVCDPQKKEIVALISEEDLDAYRKSAEHAKLGNIRMRGGVCLSAHLKYPDPSATQSLPHPAMAASAGGPLAVEVSEDENQPTLVRPHMRALLSLDPVSSLSVKSGQIGRLTISDDRTLATRLWDYLSADAP